MSRFSSVSNQIFPKACQQVDGKYLQDQHQNTATTDNAAFGKQTRPTKKVQLPNISFRSLVE